MEDHLVVRLKSKRECYLVMTSGPWFMEGQLLAIDEWEPNFVPSRRIIQKVVVWLRLPSLPLEYWEPTSILAVVAKADRP